MNRKEYMAKYQREWWARQPPETRERYLVAQRERTRKRQATPEGKADLRRRAKIFRDKLKATVMAAYGGCCACCGENEIEFLTIDHKIPVKSQGRPTSYGFYLEIRRQGFPDTFQVLCFNCNHAKGKAKECPHRRIYARRFVLLQGITA